jgi:hypothetical protein
VKAHLPPDSPERNAVTQARLLLAKRLFDRGRKYRAEAELHAAIGKMLENPDPFLIGLYIGIDWTMEGCPDEDFNLVTAAYGPPPPAQA